MQESRPGFWEVSLLNYSCLDKGMVEVEVSASFLIVSEYFPVKLGEALEKNVSGIQSMLYLSVV